MQKQATPLDWRPPDSARQELKCFRREDPFERGAALSLIQAEELQHRRRMLEQLIKLVLDQSVRDEITFRGRDGYVTVEGTHPLDPLNTVAMLRETFEYLTEFLHASEVMAALANFADGDALGEGKDAAHAVEVLRRLAKKRSVKGAPLAGVFHYWMVKNARAGVQQLDVTIEDRVFKLRIPSKNRIAAQTLEAAMDTQRVLNTIERTSANHDVYVITTVEGKSMVVPKSAVLFAPERGATVSISGDELRRARSVRLYRWKSKANVRSDTEDRER